MPSGETTDEGAGRACKEKTAREQVAVGQSREAVHRHRWAREAIAERRPAGAVPTCDVVDEHTVESGEVAADDQIAVGHFGEGAHRTQVALIEGVPVGAVEGRGLVGGDGAGDGEHPTDE